MSKADGIRKALKDGKKLTKAQTEEAIGQKIPNIYAMLKPGELLGEGERGNRTFRLDPDYKPSSSRRKKKQRAQKKSAKTTRKTRSIKDVARALLDSPKGNGIADLALDNYREASAQLRRAVVDQVDGYEHDTVLSAALVNHERAEKMAQAAGAF